MKCNSIKDMISSLKQYGSCAIDSDVLLEALETQVKEEMLVKEEMHLVRLFAAVSDDISDEKLIYTNAPDHVIESICEDIKRDGLLDNTNKINGILEVLKARGYKFKTVDDMPQFGFSIR